MCEAIAARREEAETGVVPAKGSGGALLLTSTSPLLEKKKLRINP